MQLAAVLTGMRINDEVKAQRIYLRDSRAVKLDRAVAIRASRTIYIKIQISIQHTVWKNHMSRMYGHHPNTLATPLLGVENQRANLNRLPMRRLLGAARICESRVRGQPSAIGLRVVALDERDLVGGLAGEMPPLVLRVVAHAVRATGAVRVYEVHGHEVTLVEVPPVGDRQWLVRDRMVDGPPDVDDTDTAFEQAVSLLGQMVLHPLHARVVCLVDVNAFLSSI